jgi:hypothetical protein
MGGTAVALSVVSHGQNALANLLLGDLGRLQRADLQVLVTQNMPDPEPIVPGAGVQVIENLRPAGFGANHNAAFRRCDAPYFCVVNPDVRLDADPFPALIAALQSARAAVAGPRVCDSQGRVEDSARRFPTIAGLLRKLVAGAAGPDYPVDRGPLEVDWVAGMFMLFRSDAFRAAGGFDERFFLYYEDVDLCRRLSALGHACVYQPQASVIHDARRASRRNLRLMGLHAASAMRYLARRYR